MRSVHPQSYRNHDSRPYQKSGGYEDNQNYPPRPVQTLYISQNDLSTALVTVINLLKGNDLNKDAEGFTLIDDVCSKLKQVIPDLGYINRNHIVELFFKDKDRKVLVSGVDRIKYKEIRYVQPPNSLYFGTLTGLVSRMMQFGIKSSTKGYIKLYGSVEAATEFGKRFMNQEGDSVSVIEIDAQKAFSEGLKFSTYKDDEFVVIRLDKRYLKGPLDAGDAVEMPILPDEPS